MSLKTLYAIPEGIVADINQMSGIPFDLLINQPNNALTISANQAANPVMMTAPLDGPLVVGKFAYKATGALTMMLSLQDGTNRLPLMNNAVHIETICGTNINPYYLPCALLLEENRSIVVNANDISAASNTFRPCFGSKKLLRPVPDPDGMKALARLRRIQQCAVPYWYTFDDAPVSLTSGQSTTKRISINEQAHFALVTVTVKSTGAFTLNITNESTNESLVNGPDGTSFEVNSNLLCGTGAFPFKLHEPWMVGAGQKLVVNLTDLSASTNVIYLTLGGVYISAGTER